MTPNLSCCILNFCQLPGGRAKIDVKADNIPAKWDYKTDKMGNWIEKKDNDLIFKRTITDN